MSPSQDTMNTYTFLVHFVVVTMDTLSKKCHYVIINLNQHSPFKNPYDSEKCSSMYNRSEEIDHNYGNFDLVHDNGCFY